MMKWSVARDRIKSSKFSSGGKKNIDDGGGYRKWKNWQTDTVLLFVVGSSSVVFRK